jgi:hypothetical protein
MYGPEEKTGKTIPTLAQYLFSPPWRAVYCPHCSDRADSTQGPAILDPFARCVSVFPLLSNNDEVKKENPRLARASEN